MSVTVVDLAAEHRGAGPFVATSTPRLSWRVRYHHTGLVSGLLRGRSGRGSGAPQRADRLGRLGAGALAGGAAGIAPARGVPRPGHRQRRGDERLERAARHLGAAAGGRRLVGTVHRAGRRDRGACVGALPLLPPPNRAGASTATTARRQRSRCAPWCPPTPPPSCGYRSAEQPVAVGSGEHELSMELSAAQRHRYLPSREGARLHLDSPLADVLADQPAREALRRNRAFGVLMRDDERRHSGHVAPRGAAVVAPPCQRQAARRTGAGPHPPVMHTTTIGFYDTCHRYRLKLESLVRIKPLLHLGYKR